MSHVRRRATPLLLVLLALAATQTVADATPQLLRIQGFLSDLSGPREDPVTMTFALCRSEAGDDCDAPVVPLGGMVDPLEGRYSVELPIGQTGFDGPDRWLAITVDGELLSPRVRVVSAPFAYVADTLDGFTGAQLNQSAAVTQIQSDVDVVTGEVDDHVVDVNPHPSYVKKTGDVISGALTVGGKLTVSTNESVDGAFGAGALVVRNTSGSLGVHIDANDIRTVGAGSLNINGDNVNNTRLNNLLHIKVDGKVGVGTSVPNATLDVNGTANVDGALTMRNGSGVPTVELHPAQGGSAEGGRLVLSNGAGQLTGLFDGDFNGSSGTLRLFNQDTGLAAVKIDAQESGDPTQGAQITLHNTTGDATIVFDADFGTAGEGWLTADVVQLRGGSDLSEGFDVRDDRLPIEPGSVLSIDPTKPGRLALSAEPYDPRVAGIVAGAGGVRPGLLMGQAGSIADGDYPVALTGRVYCKVDARFGPVEPGAMLTTSATPGHAMVASDRDRMHGAILGKAMTGLVEGQGLVLVLVALQ